MKTSGLVLQIVPKSGSENRCMEDKWIKNEIIQLYDLSELFFIFAKHTVKNKH